MRFRVFWDVAPRSHVEDDPCFRDAYYPIALMMEAVRTSETSVSFNVTTRSYIPENSKVYIRRREKNISYNLHVIVVSG
jgi:hypothetical protein